MHKQLIYILMLLPVFSSQVSASDSFNKWSLTLKPGGILTVGGHFTDTEKLGDVVNIGAGLGPGLRYKISENIYVDAGYTFIWMSVKEDQKPFAYKEKSPAFNLEMVTLNGTFYLVSGYLIEPYITLGCGVYPWKFSGSAIGGEAWPAPGNPEQNFSDVSFGLNVGLGIEMFAWRHISLTGEVKYSYLFAKNEAKFGTDDFTEQTFLGVNIGIIYYFGR